MLKQKFYFLLCLFVLAVFSCSVVFAQDYDLGNVIVSATKTEAYQGEVGASTTVITAKDIEKSGKISLSEVLNDAPGISLRRNSVYGGVTSLDIRGAKSGQTMVLIDGVEVYDPIAIDRDFDFAHLTTDNIEQIEIVRGPQSTLYGANAMAGVVNIITKKGHGPAKVDYLIEGGSFDTFRESLGVSAGNDDYNYSAVVSRIDSAGVSKARGGAENDGYKSTTLSANISKKVLSDGAVYFVSRYTDAEFDIDDSFPTAHDDPNRKNFSKQFTAKTGLSQAINENWDQDISYSFVNMERRDRDPSDSVDTTENDDSRFRGNVQKFQWQNNVSLTDNDLHSLGFDYQEERGSSFADTSFPSRLDRRSLDNHGYFYQAQVSPMDALSLIAGARIDDHDIFGQENTYRGAASYIFDKTQTRLKASYATAFKAPSLYQLYDGTNGNSTLNAEKSKGFDVGAEQYLFNERAMFGITYFNNKFKDLISWTEDFPGAWTGKYTNIKKAATSGMEFESSFKIREDLIAQANYTYTDTKDKDTNKEFGRRPKNQASAGLDYAYSEKGSVNFAGRFIGTRFDDDANTRKLKQYFLFDLTASYNIADDAKLFWRVENLFDRDYELISGFDGLGRAVYAGVKGNF